MSLSWAVPQESSATGSSSRNGTFLWCLRGLLGLGECSVGLLCLWRPGAEPLLAAVAPSFDQVFVLSLALPVHATAELACLGAAAAVLGEHGDGVDDLPCRVVR